METPDHEWSFWRPVVRGDTFSPVLGPKQKADYVTLSTVHGGQHFFFFNVTFEQIVQAAFVCEIISDTGLHCPPNRKSGTDYNAK